MSETRLNVDQDDVEVEMDEMDLNATISKQDRRFWKDSSYSALGHVQEGINWFKWMFYLLATILTFWVVFGFVKWFFGYDTSPSTTILSCPDTSCPNFPAIADGLKQSHLHRLHWPDMFDNMDLQTDDPINIKWLPHKRGSKEWRDGLYLDYRNGVFSVGDIQQGYPSENPQEIISNEVLLYGPHSIHDYFVSPTGRYLLLISSPESVFRNSFTATYHLCNLDHFWKDLPELNHTWPMPNSCVKVPAPSFLDEGLGPRETIKKEQYLQNPTFSPDDEHLSYVHENNLYLLPLKRGLENTNLVPPIQITKDGKSYKLFNGVPDWVYEEEVLEGASHPIPSSQDVNGAGGGTLKWSHDGKYLAFWKFDDSKVEVVDIPHIDEHYRRWWFSPLFSREWTKHVAYPTPGTPNPHVYVEIYNVETDKVYEIQFPGTKDAWKDRIVFSTDWYHNNQLLIRLTNRLQDVLSEYLVSLKDDEWIPKLVREIKHSDNAWIDFGNVPSLASQRLLPDNSRIVLQLNGEWIHLAFYEDALQLKPKWITEGEWDILQILHVQDDRIWYTSSEQSSIEAHVFTQTLNGYNSRSCLTCEPPFVDLPLGNHEWFQPGPTNLPRSEGKVGTAGTYGTSQFSPSSGFVLISSHGPSLPRTSLWSTIENKPILDLIKNDRLSNILQKGNWELPGRKWRVWKNREGLSLNVLEILPPKISFDDKLKYPALIRVYGGPNSQLVSSNFDLLRIHNVLASNPYIPFVVYMIDPRGTGGKGRSFRSRVSERLGIDESEDVIDFAEWLGNGGNGDYGYYIDSMKIGLWGWSYGGFLTLYSIQASIERKWGKDLERWGVFGSAVAVAPVTDWLYYDSIYTERYMKSPPIKSERLYGKLHEEDEIKEPTDKYYNSSLHHLPLALSKAMPLDPTQPFNLTYPNPHLLIVHGTSDDNVHSKNSLLLWSSMIQNLVDPTAVRLEMMPDSDHGIRAQDGKATWQLYRMIQRHLLHSLYSSCPPSTLDSWIAWSDAIV